jgi:hypothetical protein
MKAKDFIALCKEARDESQEQREVNIYCTRKKIPMFAIPNGTHKSIAARQKFKAEGLKAGVPDLMIPYPNNNYHGLFIEMKQRPKTLKNGSKSYANIKVSPEQDKWILRLREQGYEAKVCYGADEAIELIEEYMSECV